MPTHNAAVANRPGLSVTSEMILVIGLLILAIALLPATMNIISGESSGIVEAYQGQIAEDISAHVVRIANQGDDFIAITYYPPTEQYTIVVENNTQVTVTVPGGETFTTGVEEVLIEDTRIEDAEVICFRKEQGSDTITLQEGECPLPDTLPEDELDWEDINNWEELDASERRLIEERDTNLSIQPESEEDADNETVTGDTFDVAYVPLGYDNSGAFVSDAEQAYNRFVEESPFSECGTPEDHIQPHFIEDMSGSCSEYEPVQSMDDVSFTNRPPMCNECWSEARNIAGDDYDLVVGLCASGDCPGIVEGRICGCAPPGPGTKVSTTRAESCDGTPFDTVVAHEMGHNFGLMHMQCGAMDNFACGGNAPNSPDCGPNDGEYIMSYCQQNRFGDAAYSHLESVFSSEIEGCTS